VLNFQGTNKNQIFINVSFDTLTLYNKKKTNHKSVLIYKKYQLPACDANT